MVSVRFQKVIQLKTCPGTLLTGNSLNLETDLPTFRSSYPALRPLRYALRALCALRERQKNHLAECSTVGSTATLPVNGAQFSDPS